MNEPVLKEFVAPLVVACLVLVSVLAVPGSPFEIEPKNISGELTASAHSTYNGVRNLASLLSFGEQERAEAINVSETPGPVIIMDRVSQYVDLLRTSAEGLDRVGRHVGAASNASGDIGGYGILTVPVGEEGYDAAVAEFLQNQFSDEVTISLREGEPGRVKPIFRDGKSEEYLFMLVPVEE